MTLDLETYKIHIGDFWKDLQLANYSSIFVLVDENTKQYCLPVFEKNIKTQYYLIEIKSGEIHKNIATCQYIWSQMVQYGADRKSCMINLGGGVIGDMGGFTASTFFRGMDFIQIPTTLLSQVDASIGGKLGIDFMDLKNAIGLFKNPTQVCVSADFLNTLSKREIRSGFAELIKHGLIASKQDWNELLAIKNIDQITNWEKYIIPSLKIKKNVVQKDPFEMGLRKSLNFGHTIGHAIESHALSNGISLLHGEAVAIGLICESYLSHKIVGLSKKSLEEISSYIIHHYGRYTIKKSNFETYLQLMTKDKKNKNQIINFTMISEIGTVILNQTANNSLIQESLEYYISL